MKPNVVTENLAPCGLDCGRCVRFQEGAVAKAARSLVAGLEGYAKMAAKMANMVPVLAGYPQFEAVLALMAAADCTGCRNGSANCLPLCAAKTCFREKRVDFCADCGEFPCERNRYPEPLKQRWIENNRRIREIGAGAYYQEQLQKPRY